jgi:LysR family pca operon transcriptional activator
MIDSRIKFRHVQIFQAVALHNNLQRASEALSVTQPAVSKSLTELEEILQVRLFERSRKGAMLTRQGKLFQEHAEAIANAMQRATNSMSQARSLADTTIKIGATSSLMPFFLPEVLLEFRRRTPNIQVRLRTGTTAQMMARLLEREVDLVLCRSSDPEQMSGLSFEYLYVDPLVIAVRPGHPLLQMPNIANIGLADIRRFPALHPIKGPLNRQAADNFAIREGIGPADDFIENISTSFGRSYTIRSDVVWYVPWSAIKRDVEEGFLATLPLPAKISEETAGLMGRAIGLMMRVNSVPSPAALELINIIRETADGLRAKVL